MPKVLIASQNPVKIQAVQRGFERMFPNETFTFEGISVPSDVSDQPMSNNETFDGASNRCDNAQNSNVEADYYVGIEGGLEQVENELECFAWIVISSKDGLYGKGRTGTFFLPPKVVELIHQGKELGEVDDIVFGRENSKQNNGAVGILTEDVIDRTSYYTEAVILALIPFKNPNLY